jgi:hypothetical protein
MSDTPETDALVASINSDTDIIRHEHDFCEMTWLARRLERERDEWRKAAFEITKQANKSQNELERERDEAIKTIDMLKRDLTDLIEKRVLTDE